MIHRYPIRNLDSPAYNKTKLFEILIDDENNYCWIEFKNNKGELERLWYTTYQNQIDQVFDHFKLEQEY